MPADAGDLHGNHPDDSAVATGLDRPSPDSGPVAEPPIVDPTLDGPTERPLG